MFLFFLWGSESGVKHHNERDLLTLLVDWVKKDNRINIMRPMCCSSAKSSRGALKVGRHLKSQNMNINDFISKVIICCVMRIDRFDERNLQTVYSGTHKLVGLMRREQRFCFVRLWLWLYGNNRYSTPLSVRIPVIYINHIGLMSGHTGRTLCNYSLSIAGCANKLWETTSGL